jgi:hypothetical protein
MTLLPLFNATLTSVVGVGGSPDYDRDPIPGVTKFSGSERVFWKEESLRETFGGAGGVVSDIVLTRSMLVDPSVDVDWAQGDTVTTALDDGGTGVGRVRAFHTSGTDETGRVTRVVFEDA